MIKAIETKYKGYRFRSRLEARWAVFFDALGIEWEYEPEGFERDGRKYLPDFRIMSGGDHWWVEVKGDRDWLKNNAVELDEMHDFGGILEGFADCGMSESINGGLIVLGDIPAPDAAVYFIPVIGHRKGVNLYWRAIAADGAGNFQLVQLNQIMRFFSGKKFADEQQITWLESHDFQPIAIKANRGWPAVKIACERARSARFEHGEVPA